MNHVESSTAKEKITVLLAEYTSLRTEIIHRTGHGFQLLTVGTAITGLIVAIKIEAWMWGFFGFAMLMFVGAICITLQSITQLSTRVSELEREINSLAGAELLQWENRTRHLTVQFGMPELGRFLQRKHKPGSDSRPGAVL